MRALPALLGLSLLIPACRAAEVAREGKPVPVSFAAAGPLAIRAVAADRREVPRYEKLELRVDLSATYRNPFDPDEIDVSAEFTTPSGQKLTVPGFVYQPFERRREGRAERIGPTGPPEWRVRFSPAETGEYRYTVTARDRSGTARSQPGSFQSVAGKRAGFVRISKEDPRYFAFDDGSPYFALGANVCWPGGGGTYDYDDWFPRYAAAGCNYARLWIGPFDVFTLERKAIPGREDTGLGRMDQSGAWRLDYVLDLAERQGLYLMFCTESFNALRIKPPHATWQSYPYSAENGGMLQKPEDFFTDEQARRHFRNRLRYFVARWGYSTHVLSWEYWNEVDIVEKYISADVAAWHREMSRYLRGIDPWKHLQTTSYAGTAGDAAVDGLPEMDYVQAHRYGARDTAADFAQWSRRKREAYRKPYYMGEFGLDSGGAGGDRDTDGLSLHNGLWASVMSGDAGAAMLWWWDSYIHPRDLYYHLAAVSAFTRGVDWPREGFQPVAGASVAFATRPARPDRRELPLAGTTTSWSPSPANQPNTFVVPRSGKVEGLERLSGVQHGVRNHPTLRNPATFQVDYAAPGKFVVGVRGVSGHGGAALKVTLDGKTVLERDFADPDGNDKTDTLNHYNGPNAVDVPGGRHAIVVENTGSDWFFVDYALPAYVESWDPRLRAFALAGERLVLAWVQHADHTWSRRADGVKAEAIAGTVLRVPVARPGRYRVELWDTYQGKVTETREAAAQGGQLVLPLPGIATDLAVKARRL